MVAGRQELARGVRQESAVGRGQPAVGSKPASINSLRQAAHPTSRPLTHLTCAPPAPGSPLCRSTR